MIKNRTPYLGKIFLTFEKYPEYRGRTILNKIHINLGFTKLVSRVKPNKTESGFEIDPKKIEIIERLTGGKIQNYQLDGRPEEEFTLYNQFMSQDDVWIGGIEDGWWYANNQLVVLPEHISGVAMKVKKEFLKMDKSIRPILNYKDQFIEGFYGYTHRGGALFKIGDRIFDPGYHPQPEDYEPKEWEKYKKKLRERILKEVDEYGSFGTSSLKNWVPFNRRGNKTITNWDEAEDSAKRLVKYLS